MPRHRGATSQGHFIVSSLRKSVGAVLQYVPGYKASRDSGPHRKTVVKDLRIVDSVPPEIMRRRIALQACGILDQSHIYGDPRLYDVRDHEFESSDLRAAHAGDKGKEDVSVKSLVVVREKDVLFSERNSMSPAPPYSPLPLQSAPSTSSATKYTSKEKPEASRMRRIGSIVDEIDKIDDEESRRLTEVAYLC